MYHAVTPSALQRRFQDEFFFFNDTATTEIYTLSLHDALPISGQNCETTAPWFSTMRRARSPFSGDRKSTRLNSSHANISYAVFCLKKKKSRCSPNRRDTCISLPTADGSTRDTPDECPTS